MKLPPVQTELMKELKKTGRPLILVNMSGSVMSFDWESRNADAILQAWYGGQAAGDAITDVLFGDYNPAGPYAVDYLYETRIFRISRIIRWQTVRIVISKAM